MSYINLTKEQEAAVKIAVKDAKQNILNDGSPLCSIRKGRHLILANWNKFVIIHTDACSNHEDGDYKVELVGKNITFTKIEDQGTKSAGAMVDRTLTGRRRLKKYTCTLSDIPAIIEINRDTTKPEFYNMNLAYLMKLGFGSIEHVLFYLPVNMTAPAHPFLIENYMEHITWGIMPMLSPTSCLEHWEEVNNFLYGEEEIEEPEVTL